MKRIAREPDVRTKLAAPGLSVAGDTPELYAACRKVDVGKREKVIRTSGIEVK